MSQDRPGLAMGSLLPLGRPRFAGAVTAGQRAELAQAGIAMAFDPAQGGWVQADAVGEEPDLPVWAGLSPVALRPWRADDLDAYHAQLSDPALWRYLPEPMPEPFDRPAAAVLLDIAMTGAHHLTRAIEHRGQAIGQARLLFAGWPADTAELSYWLARERRGAGLAGAGVRLMLDAGFAARPGLRRIVAFVHPDNGSSARLLGRAGFARIADRATDGWHGFALARG